VRTKFVVEKAEGPVPEIAYVTGADGVARLGLPPGKVSLRFFLPDGRSCSVLLAITGEPNRTYEVQIEDGDL